MAKSKGDRYERRLVDFLDAAGYAVMRAPSSGSATTRDLPDVLGLRLEDRVAIEQKYIGESDGHTYLDGEELEALERFADVADATPLVTARWRGTKTFYVYELPELRLEETDGGNVRLDPSTDWSIRLSDDGGPGLEPDGVDDRGYLVRREGLI